MVSRRISSRPWLSDDPDQLTLTLELVPGQDGAEDGQPIGGYAVPSDDQSSTTPERVPEPDVADVDDDPIIAMWLGFRSNPQKGGREWVLRGAPAVLPWDEVQGKIA
jgi:hypothetical protein